MAGEVLRAPEYALAAHATEQVAGHVDDDRWIGRVAPVERSDDRAARVRIEVDDRSKVERDARSGEGGAEGFPNRTSHTDVTRPTYRRG